jgi:hypothetical protein
VAVTIREPKDNAIVTESRIKVDGWVSDAKATVWVNDCVVTVVKYEKAKSGSFYVMVDLTEGENEIKVVAVQGKAGKWKNVISKTATVTYTPSE